MNRHSIDDPTQVGCAKQRPTVLVGTVCDYLDCNKILHHLEKLYFFKMLSLLTLLFPLIL